jgi:mono/diheme cytochrome c family protein
MSLVSPRSNASARLCALVMVLWLTAGCLIGRRGGLQPEKDGRAVYLEACASCHGPGGEGDGPVATALKTRPADLTRLAARHGGAFPRDYACSLITGERTILAHGPREMPVWNVRFAPSASGGTVGAAIYSHMHLERILAYLESIQRPAPRAP